MRRTILVWMFGCAIGSAATWAYLHGRVADSKTVENAPPVDCAENYSHVEAELKELGQRIDKTHEDCFKPHPD